MGIIDRIEHMQKQPLHRRKRSAAIISGTLTGIIFIVWLSVLFPRDVQRQIAQKEVAKKDTTSMQEMFQALQEGYGGVREEVTAAQDGFQQFAAAAALAGSTTATTTDGYAAAYGTAEMPVEGVGDAVWTSDPQTQAGSQATATTAATSVPPAMSQYGF